MRKKKSEMSLPFTFYLIFFINTPYWTERIDIFTSKTTTYNKSDRRRLRPCEIKNYLK